MLRSVILQLLVAAPQYTVAAVNHVHRSSSESRTTSSVDVAWTFKTLSGLLLRLTELMLPTHKICLLLDGLDEFEGDFEDREKLTELVHKIARGENIKILVSQAAADATIDATSHCATRTRLKDKKSPTRVHQADKNELKILLIRPHERFTCQKAMSLDLGVLSLFNTSIGRAMTFGTRGIAVTIRRRSQRTSQAHVHAHSVVFPC